ncbi:MAG: hypothetical protein HYU97_00215 [Deltaproteobacteria bacterium]|nr:hypothetical protein [Deltaproteobacteria bacterium]
MGRKFSVIVLILLSCSLLSCKGSDGTSGGPKDPPQPDPLVQEDKEKLTKNPDPENLLPPTGSPVSTAVPSLSPVPSVSPVSSPALPGGVPPPASSPSPQSPPAVQPFSILNSKIAGGSDHTCMVGQEGQIKCWGNNYYGQLGLGQTGGDSSQNKPYAATIPDLEKVSKVVAGGDYTCALLSDTKVKCWGYNRWGQLGNGQAGLGTTSPKPVAVKDFVDAQGNAVTKDNGWLAIDLRGVVDIAASFEHTCALMDNKQVRCWGRNVVGQLGNGKIDSSDTGGNTVPGIGEYVKDLSNAEAIAVGKYHSCAIISNPNDQKRKVKCWGYNNVGQLGNGKIDPNVSASSLVDVMNIDNAVAIAAGELHACALLSDKKIKCWGYNNVGQLGNSKIDPNVPASSLVDVMNIDNAVAIAAGAQYTCAVLENQKMKCWGDGSSGQLGNGNYNKQGVYIPDYVKANKNELFGNVHGIDLGWYHSCAWTVQEVSINEGGSKSTYKPWCWGYNANKQLGLFDDQAVPHYYPNEVFWAADE